MILFKRFKIRLLNRKIRVMQQARLSSQPSNEVLAKEIALYKTLSDVYWSLRKRKKYPFAEAMMKECLRAAASLDNADAQYQLGEKLLEEAKFREKLEKEGLFANSMNQRLMKQLYEEAHAYLLTADNLGHIMAKRLRGLCYINGWGVEYDKNKGFDLVVASIDKENSWDKVPQIFAAIGLNKPEFFSALGQHRRSN